MQLGETKVIAEFVAGHRSADVPREVWDRTKLLLLDHIGVALFALGNKWCDIAIQYAREFSCVDECSVFGQSWRTSAQHAALANGVCAHGYELDDNHEGGAGHPGAAIIPAAFAIAEKAGASGIAFLHSIVLGYEVMGRMGRALGREGTKQHHPSGQTGGFGAAAASAKLLGLSATDIANAFGISGALASGVMEFTEDPNGSMIKRLYGGWPAQSGVIATTFASRGFTGPSTMIEGRYGLLRSITSKLDIDALTRNLGLEYEIMHVAVKPYACCRVLHPVVEAINEIKSRIGVDPRDVTQIVIGATEKMITKHMSYAPESIMSAQYSLPFSAAMALHRDVNDPAAFDDDALADADIAATCQKVKAEFDADIDAGYPVKFSARVTLHMQGGKTERATVWNPRGSSDSPYTRTEFEDRFRRLTAAVLSEKKQNEVIAAVSRLESPDSHAVSDLCRLIRCE